jgi:purine-nucleoside phosphorylase
MCQKIKKILITVAHFPEIKDFWGNLHSEGRIFSGKPVTVTSFNKDITVVIGGNGYKKGLSQFSEIIKNLSPTDLILNVGAAGSLESGFDPGECFIPDKFVYDDEEENSNAPQLLEKKCPPLVLNILKDRGFSFKSGTLVTVKEPVESSKSVEKLRSLYDASAVDMEAFYLAQKTSQKGFPFASLKIISDRADFKKSLPNVSAKIDLLLRLLIREI